MEGLFCKTAYVEIFSFNFPVHALKPGLSKGSPPELKAFLPVSCFEPRALRGGPAYVKIDPFSLPGPI